MDIVLEKLNSPEIKHYGTFMYMYIFMFAYKHVCFILRLCVGWVTNFRTVLEVSDGANSVASRP